MLLKLWPDIIWKLVENAYSQALFPIKKIKISGMFDPTNYTGKSYKTKIKNQWFMTFYRIREESEILNIQPYSMQLMSCGMGVDSEMNKIPLFITNSCIFNSLIHKSFL